MITSGIMEMLHESIQIYDKLCGKNYLIVFGTKNKYNFMQLTIRQSSFWHLLGCSLDKDTNAGKSNTYLRCKNKEDVSDKISSIHSFSEIAEKYSAMKNVFNFIEKASQIKVCYVAGCPEEHYHKIEYEVKKDISSELMKYIPNEIRVSLNLAIKIDRQCK